MHQYIFKKVIKFINKIKKNKKKHTHQYKKQTRKGTFFFGAEIRWAFASA